MSPSDLRELLCWLMGICCGISVASITLTLVRGKDPPDDDGGGVCVQKQAAVKQ